MGRLRGKFKTVPKESISLGSTTELGSSRILDSAWSPERSKFNAKVERQPRRLNDGTAFEVYKRYCDQDDISGWAREYDVRLDVEHFGAAFYAVSGTFGERQAANLALQPAAAPSRTRRSPRR